MWGGSAFIQEAIGIFIDVADGGASDWADVISTGVPTGVVVLLGIIFLIIGSLLSLRLFTLAGMFPDQNLKKKVVIGIVGIIPFFLISLIILSFFRRIGFFQCQLP